MNINESPITHDMQDLNDFSIHEPSIRPRESLVSLEDESERRIYAPDQIEVTRLNLWNAWVNTCSEDANEPAENFCAELNDGWDVWDAILIIEQQSAEIERLKAEVKALHPTTSGDRP